MQASKLTPRALRDHIAVNGTDDLQAGDVGVSYLLRMLAGVGETTIPVVIVPGTAGPSVKGEPWHYTTPGGRAIHFPNAYKWPKVYHASTQHVEAGIDWLVKTLRTRKYRRSEADGVPCYVEVGSRVTIHGVRVERALSQHYRLWLVTRGDDTYHRHECIDLTRPCRDRDTRAVARKAVHAWANRRHADRSWTRALAKPLEAITVTVDDVHDAGACWPGIESFRRRHPQTQQVEEMPAPELLALADPSSKPYIQRAIAYAAQA